MLQILLSNIVFAASGGASDHHGIPWSHILVQAVNIFGFGFLLFYFSKNSIKAYFKNKQEDFEKALKQADIAKKEAKEKQEDARQKVEALKANFDQSVKESKENAEKMKQDMIAEAKEMAKAIKLEAEKTYQNQLNEAIKGIKTELLSKSLESAEAMLKSKMQKKDHEDLQDHLVKSFGAAK